MITEICKKAKAASVEMAKLSAEAKNTALCRMANALEANADKILAANKADVEAAKAKGLKSALLDRLALDQRKIQAMARGLREVSGFSRPDWHNHKQLDKTERLDNQPSSRAFRCCRSNLRVTPRRNL